MGYIPEMKINLILFCISNDLHYLCLQIIETTNFNSRIVMKKLSIFGGLFVLLCTMIACGDKTKSNPEADSLRTELTEQMEAMDEMNLFLDAVNMSMDSVVDMEGTVLRTSGESPLSRKEQIKQNMEAYKKILEQQRERLNILEKKLSDSNAYSEKMKKTIESLKQQLEEKDAAIAKLSEELEQRNYQIEELKDNVDQLNVQVAEQEEDIKAKAEEIDQRTNEMNEVYYFMGDKNALKDAGLAESGFLKKLKLNTSNFNKNLFKKIDKRDTKIISIPSKKAEVMTPMPEGSYKINKTGENSSELVITDPTRFWSVSPYLVIRY